jgi:hypothetical protein
MREKRFNAMFYNFRKTGRLNRGEKRSLHSHNITGLAESNIFRGGILTHLEATICEIGAITVNYVTKLVAANSITAD